MASDLEALRAECDALSTKRFRVAVVSLLILFVGTLAFTRAFRRIDREEVRTRMQKMVKLKEAASAEPKLSYVFTKAWKDVLESQPKARVAQDVPFDYEALQVARKELEDQARELEQLAAQWFSMNLPLGGAHIEFDLRYWLPLLPLVLWTSWAYLGIVGEKLRATRQLAAALVRTDSSALDRLMFSGPQTYSRTPEVFGVLLYATIVVLLVVSSV